VPVSIERRSEFRPGDARHVVQDVSRLRALGFHARTPVEDGLRSYVAWIRTRSRVRDYFAEAEQLLKRMRVVRSAAV